MWKTVDESRRLLWRGRLRTMEESSWWLRRPDEVCLIGMVALWCMGVSYEWGECEYVGGSVSLLGGS